MALSETQQAIFNTDSFKANLTNEAGIKQTNRLLKNVMGLWILQECRRSWGEPDWMVLYDEARAASVTASIDPDDARYLAPGLDMPERILDHVRETGQAIPDSRGGIVRLVLESLAAKYALVLQELERARASPGYLRRWLPRRCGRHRGRRDAQPRSGASLTSCTPERC